MDETPRFHPVTDDRPQKTEFHHRDVPFEAVVTQLYVAFRETGTKTWIRYADVWPALSQEFSDKLHRAARGLRFLLGDEAKLIDAA